MIIGNKATEIGDSFLIEANIPIVGVIAISTYTDDLTGVTGTRFFVKEFRFSIDGINYSSWIELTDPNLSSIIIASNDTFFIDYRYTRSGTDATGDLYFNSVTIDGEFTEPVCGEIYKNSIFADFFSCHDPEVMGWAINVTNKIYAGIVPKFITRGQTGNINDDEDYIDLFKSISWFFAYHVIYARKFEQFKNYYDLLIEFLKQRNIFVCHDEQQEDLLHILRNYYDEIRQRGTIQIIKEKSQSKPVDGELLRLICYNPIDEFLFTISKPESINWNIGTSSPLYQGTLFDNMLIKGYEKTLSAQSLSNYPLINSSDVSLVAESGINVIRVNGSVSGSGIGYTSSSDINKAMKVDTGISYEITFWIKQANIALENITFRIKAYDETGIEVDIESVVTGLSLNNFFVDKSLNQSNKYYFVRGIIYATSKPNISSSDARLNIGFGTNLRFRSNVRKILPEILIKTV